MAGGFPHHGFQPVYRPAAATQLDQLDTDVRQEADQGEPQYHADFPPAAPGQVAFHSHSAILTLAGN